MRILFLLLVLFMAGCSQTPKEQIDQVAIDHRQILAQLNDWKIKGRLAFKSDQDKFSANLNWHQQQHDFSIRLSSLLGTTLMRLTATSGLVTLEADDKEYQDTDATRLLFNVSGLLIPIDNLKQWVKGLDSQAKHSLRNANGTLAQLTAYSTSALSWQVNYADYRTVGEHVLPHLLTLKHQDILIKMKINQWELE